MITLNFETFSEYSSNCKELWEEEYHDVIGDKNHLPLDPDIEAYISAQKNNSLCILSVRDGVKLVGHVVAFIYKAPHHKTVTYAFVSTFYLSKPYRNTSLGKEMVSVSELRFAELGVQKVFYGFPAIDYLEKFFLEQGYKPLNVVYEKWIGK